MKQAPFEQNIIAMVWDCDKTLISSYMQDPLFRHYGVDGAKFWKEVNALKARYAEQGISVNSDTSYLNHILTYVKAGIFKGLNNALLREFGKELVFYPGLPGFFAGVKNLIAEDPKYKAFDIRLEHYVVSTGFAETIRGSAIAPHVDGIFGCEFIEDALQPGFLDGAAPAVCPAGSGSSAGREITQIACALDNTSKTRYLFEINKGSNRYPENVDGWQWRPDLIWFDNLRVMRSCSYYVQQLYSNNKGSRVVPLTFEGKPVVNAHGLNATAAIDDENGDIIVKIANVSAYSQVINFELPANVKAAERTLLHSDNPMEENTLDAPETVIPVTKTLNMTPVKDPANEWLMGVRLKEGKMIYSERLGGRTFVVYRFHR